MIQRIRFGTVEQVSANMISPRAAKEERLVKEGLASVGDYMLRFSGYLTDIPAHPEFPLVMEVTGLRWQYPDKETGDLEADIVGKASDDVLVINGAMVAHNHNGRIFQLAHNILHIARQIPIGGADEMIEFLDLSGALPEGGNAFHA